MALNLGAMRHRIGIQAKTTARNTAGGLVETWTTSSTVWGQVIPLAGSEKIRAMAVDSRLSHKVRMHHGDASSVTPAMRLTYDSRTFEIHVVVNRGEMDAEVEMLVSEDT